MRTALDNQPKASWQARVLFGVLGMLLAGLSIVYATMGGWSLSSASPSQRLVAMLPVLDLSALTGVGGAALLLTALGRPVWSKLLLVGLVPALVEAAVILIG